MSRWSHWSSGSEKKLGFGSFLKEADEIGGNPTSPASGETPAQKAERLGLISDGHGSYLDPNTQQIVARTVNGELVFYDQGPGGGAASDGEGGGADRGGGGGSTFATFRDPQTGLITVPPATPKTPEDLAAVPAHPPATAPAKYDDFVQKKAEGETPLIDRMAAADVPDEEEPSERRSPVSPLCLTLSLRSKLRQNPALRRLLAPEAQAYAAGDLCTYPRLYREYRQHRR